MLLAGQLEPGLGQLGLLLLELEVPDEQVALQLLEQLELEVLDEQLALQLLEQLELEVLDEQLALQLVVIE